MNNIKWLVLCLFIASCGEEEESDSKEDLKIEFSEEVLPFCTQLTDFEEEEEMATDSYKEEDAVPMPKAASPNDILTWTSPVIKVYFFGDDNDEHESILRIANEWSNFCHIRFKKETSVYRANIRVKIGDYGFSSFVGIPPSLEYSVATMTLRDASEVNDNKLFRAMVLHEFGHVLGLIHEHQRGSSRIPWKKQKVYEYYESEYGWKQDRVDDEVFKVYDESTLNGTIYDPLSIMHYYIPPSLTERDLRLKWNYELSQKDKEFIKSIYPL